MENSELQNNQKLKQNSISDFKENKCCVIIPTYNNALSISDVVVDVSEYCSDIYVVNDGCTDDTLTALEKYKDKITIIGYENNQGKGNAIITGFRKAFEDGFKYAITIDSDGQHYGSDLPVFLETLKEEPEAVLIGSRQLAHKGLSSGSSFANKFSNFWFKVETGISLPDTQSGYRLYPLEPISKIKFFTRKYEFEIEIIVRLSWRGFKVLSVPIDVFYPTPEDRISHFRPFKDFFRISVLNTVLVFFALLFFLPRNIVRKYRKKTFKQIIKEDVLGGNSPVHTIAISIGFGVFMGIVPIWGYQLLVGFSLAHIFKLNKSVFFVFANVSLPPLIPVILYLSYILGGYMIGEGTWAIKMADISFETVNLKQYIIGSVALAIFSGSLFGFVSYFLLKMKRNRTK